MDPITIGIMAVGAGISLFGSSQAVEDAKKAAALQKQILAKQQAIEGEKQKAMELDASRRTLEVYRNMQRAQSIAQSNAVAQGANFSSGLLGGKAQARGEANTGLLGISQNLQIGRQIFAYNKEITGYKSQLADVQASMTEDQAITSFGNALMSNATGIGKMFSGFGTANTGGYSGQQLPNSAMISGYGIY